MKHSIIMGVCSVLSACALADAKPTCYTNRHGRVVTYITNAVEIAQNEICRSRVVKLGVLTPSRVCPADRLAVDDVLATATNIVYCPFPECYPKGMRRYIANVRATGGSEGIMNFVENQAFGDKTYAKSADRLIDSLDMINWDFYGTPWATRNSLKRLISVKNSIVLAANKTTRAKIRSEGKSFVVKDGVNPVQERLDALTKALDAPYFAGLEAACTNCGIVVSSDFRKHFPTPAQVAELKRKVFVGEKAFTDENKVYLMVALGTEEYNKFVKAYNGDEQ